MMGEKFIYKNVVCSICEKKGKIKIRKSDRKIISKNFYYFGRIDLNSWKESKYAYEVLFDKNDKLLLGKDGHMTTKKVKNDFYDEKAKPHYIKYFECEKCYKESPKKLKTKK